MRPISKHSGFVTVIGLFLVLSMGGICYLGVINVRWVDASKAAITRTEQILYDNNSLMQYSRNPFVNGRFYRNDENLVWWTFISKNIVSIKDVLSFKQIVKDMHKETKQMINKELPAHIASSAMNIREGKQYKGYIQRFNDEGNGLCWFFPVFRNIREDELINSDLSKDTPKSAFIDTKWTRKSYPAKYLTSNGEFNSYYVDHYREKKFKDSDLFLPFSNY